jgi:hypothetical protein
MKTLEANSMSSTPRTQPHTQSAAHGAVWLALQHSARWWRRMWHGCRAPIRSRQHSAPLIPAARGREANPDGGGREANPGGGGANPVDPRWIRLAGMMSSSSLLSFLSSMPTQLPGIAPLHSPSPSLCVRDIWSSVSAS